jgi:uncharacterized protein (TIGR03083 family)
MDLVRAATIVSKSGEALTASCRENPDALVAACPGWNLTALTDHVGAVHGWTAANLLGDPDAMAAFPSGSGPDWADEQRAALLDAFDRTDPDAPVWAFAPRAPARFWWRRQQNETALHAWDAVNAVGRAWPIDMDTAADGIDELLNTFLPRRELAWGAGRTLHVHHTDGDGEWLVTIAASPVVTRGHAKGDIAVRGSALDLWLWLTNRPNDAAVFGDQALADAWAANFSM